MRGFLSKWFSRKSAEKSLTRTNREEPVLSATAKPHQNHLPTEEHEHVAHPDTEFLDYEDWASESIETQITPNRNSHTEQLSKSEHVTPKDVVPDMAWQDEHSIDVPNNQELEINSKTRISYEEENIGTGEQELIAVAPLPSKTVSNFEFAKWTDWINASVVPPHTLQEEKDPSGNTYLHYAAMLGSPQFCVQLLKEGWNSESINNHGQTAIDLARSNGRQNSALLMELFMSQKTSSIETIYGVQAKTEPYIKAKSKQKSTPREILKAEGNYKKAKAIKEKRETIRKSRLADDYNSNQSNSPGTNIVLRTAASRKRKNNPPTKPKISLARTENALWNIMVRDSRCPSEVWGYLMDTKDTDSSGNTLLHYATRAGNFSYSVHLLGLGWEVQVKNNDEDTPLDVGRRAGHIYLINVLSEKHHKSLDEKITDETIAKELANSENLTQVYHPNDSAKNNQQDKQPITTPPGENLVGFESKHQLSDPAKTTFDKPEQIDQLKSITQSACVKCGTSFADFNTAVKLWFCPFCGAEQPDDATPKADIDSQSEYSIEDTVFSKNTGDDYQAGSLEEHFVEADTHASTTTSEGSSQRPEEGNKTHQPEAIPDRLSEEAFGSVDEGFDDNFLDIDLENYQQVSRSRNSSDEWRETANNLDQFSTDSEQIEDWEIFLDEDLEEQAHPSNQYFDDEDPLERGKIVEYASRLASRITCYQSKDRRKIYAFFVNILGDFPFYQSYAAIERLISKGSQIEGIRDAYSVKLLWVTNPNIWSSRRYNRLENNWSVSRSPKLKNSMSWRLASDLVQFHTPNELENLILNDWYVEWLNLTLHGGDTASGIDPSYSLYPTYLYEKRSLITANQNNW